MTDHLLNKIGPLIYGLGWQTEIAKRWGVSDRSMRRWVAGTHQPNDPVTNKKLRDLIDERIAELREARRLLSPKA